MAVTERQATLTQVFSYGIVYLHFYEIKFECCNTQPLKCHQEICHRLYFSKSDGILQLSLPSSHRGNTYVCLTLRKVLMSVWKMRIMVSSLNSFMATMLKCRKKRWVTELRPPPGGPMADMNCTSCKTILVVSFRSYLEVNKLPCNLIS